MLITTGPKVDDLYLGLVLWFHQNVLLNAAVTIKLLLAFLNKCVNSFEVFN